MARFQISHTTRYDYAQSVMLGEHRMLLRPRDSHEIRLISSSLTVSPPARLRWLFDVFGNSVAIATFEGTADHLQIESLLEVEHFGLDGPAVPLEPRAAHLPFAYDNDERTDLGALLAAQFPGDGAAAQWARRIMATVPDAETLGVLQAMMNAVTRELRYQVRETEGVQSPGETLSLGSGSCRDFAVLMMEGVRSLGLAARFVSGYLHVPAHDGGYGQPMGYGATHAWLQVFLPGAGWVAFDPTNGHVEGQSRIPIAIGRTPAQTAPVSGSFTAPMSAAPRMSVQVAVTSDAPGQGAPAPVQRTGT